MRRERTRPRRGAYGWSRVAVAHGSANPADGTGWPHNRRSSGTIAHLALLEFQELATPASSRFMRSRMSAASYYVGSSRPVTSRNRCAESRHHRRSKARTRRRSRRRALAPVVLLIADAPRPFYTGENLLPHCARRASRKLLVVALSAQRIGPQPEQDHRQAPRHPSPRCAVRGHGHIRSPERSRGGLKRQGLRKR